MIKYTQGTISGKSSIIDDIINKPTESPFQETLGGSFFQQYSAPPKESNIISYALQNVDQSKPELMVSLALQILMLIQSTADAFRKSRVCPDYLPQVRAYAPDDGSILIEWNFDNFRINFNIEKDNSENSWHLISNNFGEVSASGYIRSGNIEPIIVWLFCFIILSYWG